MQEKLHDLKLVLILDAASNSGFFKLGLADKYIVQEKKKYAHLKRHKKAITPMPSAQFARTHLSTKIKQIKHGKVHHKNNFKKCRAEWPH